MFGGASRENALPWGAIADSTSSISPACARIDRLWGRTAARRPSYGAQTQVSDVLLLDRELTMHSDPPAHKWLSIGHPRVACAEASPWVAVLPRA